MPDVFISYSVADRVLAKQLQNGCKRFALDAFLAETSLIPGQIWKSTILANLQSSEYFFFLATPNSIRSDACKHEIGAALAHKRIIVPILVGIDYRNLPSWISDSHGIKIDSRGNIQLSNLLTEIKRRKNNRSVATIAGAFALGVILFYNKDERSKR